MTFDSIVAEANHMGLRVNNCFQLTEGWQANFRAAQGKNSDDLAVFGRGETAVEALAAALALVKKVAAAPKKLVPPTPPSEVEESETPAISADIDDLL